ncbi:DUF4189 domain-containing protein [Kutzneria kofuensis]|uniref:DUF4189 domain-containing protein n=1 Tax=Kutzneria kofuensis TaxID=103725 RepID=UPI0035E4431F
MSANSADHSEHPRREILLKRRHAVALLAVATALSSLFGAGAARAAEPTQKPNLGIAAVSIKSATASQTGNRYGAIAYSPSKLDWGWAVNYDSESVARGEAYNQCSRATGAADCRVANAFTNSWGALALSTPNGPAGWGAGATRTDAVNTADYYCRLYGGGDSCHIVVAVDATYVPSLTR